MANNIPSNKHHSSKSQLYKRMLFFVSFCFGLVCFFFIQSSNWSGKYICDFGSAYQYRYSTFIMNALSKFCLSARYLLSIFKHLYSAPLPSVMRQDHRRQHRENTAAALELAFNIRKTRSMQQFIVLSRA